MADRTSDEARGGVWSALKNVALRPKSTKNTISLPTLHYNSVNNWAIQQLTQYDSPIFEVDIKRRQLYGHFLEALSPDLKQQYKCSTCDGFVYRYGALALVDDDGVLHSLFWTTDDSSIEPDIRRGIEPLARQIEAAKVLKEFKVTPGVAAHMASTTKQGGFNHLFFDCPENRIHRKPNSAQFAATSTPELAAMLTAVIQTYSLATVRRVAHILEQDKLPYASNHKAAARWLLDLLEADKISRNGKSDATAQHNLTYRYAASAFTGCISQLKNGALSTLFDTVEGDHSWGFIEKEWKLKTNPVQYLRPQAAPTAGNIAASERLFGQLGITENDLCRRQLVLSDIPSECIMWRTSHHSTPNTNPSASIKLFAGIIPKNPVPPKYSATIPRTSDLPPTCITFTKLLTQILPTAKRVEYKLSTNNRLFFFITGHPGTKPLMHWHSDANENRASWFTWLEPYAVEKHNLRANEWNEVRVIVPFPHLWDAAEITANLPLPEDVDKVTDEKINADGKEHEGEEYVDIGKEEYGKGKAKGKTKLKFYHRKQGFRYLLALTGIKDTSMHHLMLFPELLKGEFHGARATVEAYSKKMSRESVEDAGKKGGYVGGVAMGREMGKSRTGEGERHLVRVTDEKGEKGVWEIVLFD